MGGAIRAEIRKIFTTRLWWGLLIALVVISGGISALFASLVGTDVAGNKRVVQGWYRIKSS